jgi:uncharacterized membrane protein YfcA
MDQTMLLVGLTAMGSAFVKGVTGMAFPLFATPVVALLTDVRTAIVVLLAPNILMDVVLIVRKRFPLEHLKRLGTMLATGVVGVFVGTYLLVTVPIRLVNLILAGIVFVFVGQSLWARGAALPARWEPVASPAVGFAAGVLNGVSNTLSPIMAIYLLSLQLAKFDFVKSIALVFFSFKVAQTVAVWKWNLFTPARLWLSAAATVFAFAGFGIGLRVQDRINQRTFGRVVLVLLTVIGLLLLAKALL